MARLKGLNGILKNAYRSDEAASVFKAIGRPGMRAKNFANEGSRNAFLLRRGKRRAIMLGTAMTGSAMVSHHKNQQSSGSQGLSPRSTGGFA